MQVPADLHELDAQLLFWSQDPALRAQCKFSLGPAEDPGITRADFMHCNEDKLFPINGWEQEAEGGGFLTLSSCSCLRDKSVTHLAFLLNAGLKRSSLFNVYVVLAKHHVSGPKATCPVQPHPNIKLLRSLLFYTHVRSPQTMANLRFIS